MNRNPFRSVLVAPLAFIRIRHSCFNFTDPCRRYEGICVSVGIAPLILNLDTRCESSVALPSRCASAKALSRYPMTGKMGRPQIGLGALEKKTIFFLPWHEPRFLGCPACSFVTAPNTLFSSPERLDQLWGHSNLLFNGQRERFSSFKAVGAWVWLFPHVPSCRAIVWLFYV
jgi:hypothetical protein